MICNPCHTIVMAAHVLGNKYLNNSAGTLNQYTTTSWSAITLQVSNPMRLPVRLQYGPVS